MLETISFIITGVLTSLLAGIFFAYSISVNGALRRLKDAEYVHAMQAINIVIQNSIFFLCFMGPVVLLPLVAFFAYDASLMQFILLSSAAIIYIIGAFGVTVAGNVPLNERLAKVDLNNPVAASQARQQFEQPWNRLHAVRTIAAIAATVLIFVTFCL